MADKNFQLVRPTITTRQYPAAQFPEASNGLARGIEGLSRGAMAISETVANIKDGEEEVAKSQLLDNTAVALTEAKARVDQNGDHRDYMDRWNTEVRQIRDQANETIRSFETRRQFEHAQIQLGHLVAQANIHAQHTQQALSVDYQRAEGMQSLAGLSRLAARDPDLSGRERWANMAMDITRTLADTNVLKPTEAVEWIDQFKKHLTAERLKYFSTDLQQELDNLENKALRDPINAAGYHQEGASLVERAVGDWLPGDRKAEVLSKFADALWSSAVKAKIEADPYHTRDELKAGKYDSVLKNQSILALRGDADTEVDRIERKQEAARRENERQVGKLVSDYKEAKMSGFDWRGPVSEARLGQIAQGTEHEVDFKNIQAASRVLGLFNQMAPTEQSDYLRAIASGAKTGTEAKFASTLQEAHNKTVSGLKDDPLTFAIKQRVVPDPGPFNPMDPASLKARSLTAGLVSQRYGVPVSPLSDDEATALKNQLNSLSADGKVGMLRQLSAGFEPQNIRMIASQIGKKEDGVLATAIGLSTEAPEAASRILKGQEILKANPKFGHESAGAVTPGMKSITEETNRLLGDTYKNNAEQQTATRDAILSDYAWRSNYMGDLQGSYNAERVRLAVRDVTGGLITYKGKQIEAPRYGMTDADFSDMVKAADFPVKGFKKDDILRYGQLETVGRGKYLIKVGDAYLQGKSGPFVLTLPQAPIGAQLGGVGPR